MLIALGGCVGYEAKPPPVEASPSPSTVSYAKAGASFGFELCRRLVEAAPGKNIVFSPFSVSEALAMALDGAHGETLDVMRQVLGFGDASLEEIDGSGRELCAILGGSDSTRTLHLANSVWMRKEYPFDPSYVTRLQESHGAMARTLDFGAPASVGVINDWVKEQTRGKIDSIISGIDAQDIAFLVNAIYLKADWTDAFDPNLTSEAPFHAPDGLVQANMMRRQSEYDYLVGDGFSSVRIPYGSGQMAMYVFLPDEGIGIDTLMDQLNPVRWSQWMDGYHRAKVSLGMPRFTAKYENQLVGALSDMGLDVAFDPDRADFRGMSASKEANPGIFIAGVVHKAFIEVQEKGTEAAAVTGITVGASSAPVEPPIAFVLDRPFFYVIQDDITGAILFMGTVADPVSR